MHVNRTVSEVLSLGSFAAKAKSWFWLCVEGLNEETSIFIGISEEKNKNKTKTGEHYDC